MANVNGPRGFIPVRRLGGGEIQTNAYSIASEYSTSIFTGQVVEMTGTGTNIASAAAGNADNIGVFAGCQFTKSTGEVVFSDYWPASTAVTDVIAYVWDDPKIVFEVQTDTLAEADVGTVADHVVGSGSVVTGQAASYVDVTNGGTSGKTFRILRLVDRPDNAYGAYAKAEVVFAEHALGAALTGI